MELPKELRSLVSQSVALLGQVIRRELGDKGFQRIEELRFGMTEIRKASSEKAFEKLQHHYHELAKLSSADQLAIARSFTFMLELMNACENAYRSHRLNQKPAGNPAAGEKPRAIIYVLTAHPTEARSPQNIAIFHQIQDILIRALGHIKDDLEVRFSETETNAILHLLEIAWRTPSVRHRSPKVKDEAEHIYSLIFREDILFSLIEKTENLAPFYIRTWVGGDKDGHPGVDEKTMNESLNLSRSLILKVIRNELLEIRKTMDLFSPVTLQKKVTQLEKFLPRLKTVKQGDGKLTQAFRDSLAEFKLDYQKTIGAIHPRIQRLGQLAHAFPGLVVPLELREASSVLMSDPKSWKKLPIYKMLNLIEKVSRGGNARWYSRGFIISMTESIDHIRAAARMQRSLFNGLRLPIIPLFEEAGALANSAKIMTEMTRDAELKAAAEESWGGMVEMMVGYSDSAKEAGVLASRLSISQALPKLEKVCEKAKLTPIFFHGSGGSVDRGGGSIEDQTAWWPKSALRHYKVTIQGEMIERSLATPAIARRQIEAIAESVSRRLKNFQIAESSAAVEEFAHRISERYRQSILSKDFLKLVEVATPYSFLSVLKIGSRPAKRTSELTVKALRAIPWVLCWTQSRVLFPTWWGVGSAWNESSQEQKAALKEAFQNNPLFSTYVKALGFTLAKVELSVWKMYLSESGLPEEQIHSAFLEFESEFKRTLKCYHEICEQKDLLWFRPWLGESILLRSAMIHPLNLLQIIAKKNNDVHLLRVTVTGISSGMLTTG